MACLSMPSSTGCKGQETKKLVKSFAILLDLRRSWIMFETKDLYLTEPQVKPQFHFRRSL